MKRGRVVTGLVVLGLVAGFGYWLGNQWEPGRGPLGPGPGCTAVAGGRVSLELDQMANAATIAAVGVRLGMPDRAVQVALATALQESKLHNLPHLGAGNDHDSVGLFQQRPSQGWGSADEISDPRYSSERFYRALGRVDGWQELRVTDAAQRVQRSAYPEAYQKWAGDADVLATALLGRSDGAVACHWRQDPEPGDPTTLGTALARDWGGQVEVAPTDPPGVTVQADDPPAGWRYAHWLVAHAAAHGVTRVRFADRTWTAAGGEWSATGGESPAAGDSPPDTVHATLGG